MSIIAQQHYTLKDDDGGIVVIRPGQEVPRKLQDKYKLKNVSQESDPLEGMPGADDLRAAGFSSKEQVYGTSDEALQQVEGVGKATVAKIRELQKEEE